MTAVITGLGTISGFGGSRLGLMDGLLGGQPVAQLQALAAWPKEGSGPTYVYMDINDAVRVLDGERTRELNIDTIALLAAARLAIADAELEDVAGDRTGVVVSTHNAGLQEYAELFWQDRRDQTGSVKPTRAPLTGLNAPAAYLSIRLGARGQNMTMSNGAAGGLEALSCATRAIETGRAEIMLVGAVEILSRVAAEPLVHASRECAGARHARPFDSRRRGAILGEAAVVLVVEADDAAARRGVQTRVEVSTTASAFSPVCDVAEASGRSMIEALGRCSARPSAFAAAFAGANGSRAGDAAEAHALHHLFSEDVPVCAIKGALADTGGAAGLLEVAVATLSIQHDVLPPTAGYSQRDVDLPALQITTSAQELGPGPVMVHAWDESGSSGCAVLQRRGDTNTAAAPRG